MTALGAAVGRCRVYAGPICFVPHRAACTRRSHPTPRFNPALCFETGVCVPLCALLTEVAGQLGSRALAVLHVPDNKDGCGAALRRLWHGCGVAYIAEKNGGSGQAAGAGGSSRSGDTGGSGGLLTVHLSSATVAAGRYRLSGAGLPGQRQLCAEMLAAHGLQVMP